MPKNKETLCFFVFLCFHKQTKQTLEVLSFMKLEQIIFVKEAVSFMKTVENLAYESKMINIVIGKVHQIYTDVTSDDIARYVRQILAEDEYHRMKPTEIAKEVVAIITGSPTRKKRRPSSKAPASKNIYDYISNA